MKSIFISFILFAHLLCDGLVTDSWLLPVNCKNRKDIKCIQLTDIGQFGLLRKERPNVPSHLHTGIDIKRPNENYSNEPVFPAIKGVVISVRRDGPFAQIIVEHRTDKDKKIWTVYEHVSGILVKPGDFVTPMKAIARFMDRDELDRYGWKFNHLHFEIMKKAPVKMIPDQTHPQRLFSTYGLVCYDEKLLMENYSDPLTFFHQNIQ